MNFNYSPRTTYETQIKELEYKMRETVRMIYFAKPCFITEKKKKKYKKVRNEPNFKWPKVEVHV